MNNEIKINVPEGMEIDKENSTFECIKFKPKWIPKRGDIAITRYNNGQIVLVGEYIRENYVGFDIKGLAVFDTHSNLLTIWKPNEPPFWVLEEASASEKELLINKLKENGYIYDLNDPRVIYKKEKELPKTWEEFCENNPRKDIERYIGEYSDILGTVNGERDSETDANVLPSKEYAEAMLALCKLIQLRDCYNDGWEPNWKEESFKYIIRFYNGEMYFDTSIRFSSVLAFKTKDLRSAFWDNFKDLIEQAKLLL